MDKRVILIIISGTRKLYVKADSQVGNIVRKSMWKEFSLCYIYLRARERKFVITSG